MSKADGTPMAETPKERKARLAAEIRERAIELLKEEPDVVGHSLDDETEVFQDAGETAAVVCAGYYSDE